MAELSQSLKGRLDPESTAVCEWFCDHDGKRVEFEVRTGEGQSVSETATVKAEALSVNDYGWVSVRMVDGAIGSPGELQIPAMDEPDGCRIESHSASADAISWRDLTPGAYGGHRDYEVRVL